VYYFNTQLNKGKVKLKHNAKIDKHNVELQIHELPAADKILFKIVNISIIRKAYVHCRKVSLGEYSLLNDIFLFHIEIVN